MMNKKLIALLLVAVFAFFGDTKCKIISAEQSVPANVTADERYEREQANDEGVVYGTDATYNSGRGVIYGTNARNNNERGVNYGTDATYNSGRGVMYGTNAK